MTERTTEEIEQLDRQNYVCLWADGKKKGRLCFVRLEENGEIDISDGWVTWKRRPKTDVLNARPGSIWSIPRVPDENAVYLGYAEYAGQWERDPLFLKEMWARHRAHELKWATQTERSKVMNDDKLKEALRPVRTTYAAMNWRDRRILLAHVLEIITGGK